MKKLIIPFIILFFSSVVHADTKLLGMDWSDNPSCFVVGRSMTHWKITQYQAATSGTIAYGKIRIPQQNAFGGSNSTANCTSDTVCWVAWNAANNNPTTIKAWGCTQNYNWDALGVGQYHTFPIRNGDLSIVQGTNYFIGMRAYVMTEVLTSNAGEGCQQIHHNRGRNECDPTAKRFCSNGTCGSSGEECYEGAGALEAFANNANSGPPLGVCFTNNDIASYFDYSLWTEEGSSDTTPPAAPTGVAIQ